MCTCQVRNFKTLVSLWLSESVWVLPGRKPQRRVSWWRGSNELEHSKTYKMTCEPVEDLTDQLAHPCSFIRAFALGSMGSQGPKASLCGEQRLWSGWSEPSLGAHIILLVLSCLGSSTGADSLCKQWRPRSNCSSSVYTVCHFDTLWNAKATLTPVADMA